MKLAHLVSWAVLLPLLLAAPLVAQEPAPEPAVQSGPSAGPTFANAVLGYQVEDVAGAGMTWDDQRRSSRSSGRVLAIVGGAAFIGGLLIDGDAGTAIAVGGLVVGLIGLYQWLK